MQEVLLRTKIFTPPSRPNQVRREALLGKFNAARQMGIPFTLISAPAGFGKTSLVSDWAQSSGLPCAWLTLDRSDNDPVSFLRYIHAAIETVDSSIGESVRPALYSMQLPDSRQIITRIINDIINTGIEFILVVEDYHTIENAEIHASVNFLLDHIPPNLHLILTTRSDPPLNLALRRGRRQMAEIRAEDLRFTTKETAQFLNQTMNLDLPTEDINALNQRTEGWITGLQMAALSMQDEIDRHAFITAFRGDDLFIADYLIEEVLLHQPVEFQQFLLSTSILEQMSAPLCNAVTGRQDSQAMLNALTRANLFILPLDNRREWFRYHRLFADLLRRRFVQLEGESAIKALQQRTVDWLAGNGFPKLAVEYAVNFGNFELAADLLIQAGALYFMSNDFNALLKLTDRLPAELIYQNIILSCMVAWAANAVSQMHKSEQIIRGVELHLGISIDDFIYQGDALDLPKQAKAGLIELGVVRARTSVDTFKLDDTFRLADSLLPYLTAERDSEPMAFNLPSALRGPLLFIQGLAQFLHGDITKAGQTFQQSASEGRRDKNLHIEILSLGHMGEVQILQSQLRKALETFQQALSMPEEFKRSSFFFGISQAGLGRLAYEWNDLETAEIHLKSAVEQGQLWGNWENLLPGHSGLARIHACRGNWTAAFQELDKLLQNTQQNLEITLANVESLRALLNLRRGDLDTAQQWAESFNPARPKEYLLAWEADELVRSRIWIALGEADKAEILLKRILNEATTAGRQQHVHEALFLLAILYHLSHHEQDAKKAFVSALELAKPEGYIRSYVDEGELMQRLLDHALRQGWLNPELSSYAQDILSAFEPGTPKTKLDSTGVETLTERELEVLGYIAQGLTNPEIAVRLYLSPNTLKAHTQNIYSKLDVHNRVNAVSKARKLGLIP